MRILLVVLSVSVVYMVLREMRSEAAEADAAGENQGAIFKASGEEP
jgi:hypothetical protein